MAVANDEFAGTGNGVGHGRDYTYVVELVMLFRVTVCLAEKIQSCTVDFFIKCP